MSMHTFQFSIFTSQKRRGYTLIELIVAVGLFALVMLLASGAYIMMIGLNRQAQAMATGIDNLSFALETMTRDIRTGTNYCNGAACLPSSFTFTAANRAVVTYARGTNSAGGYLTKSTATNTAILTDPSVNIASLTFYTVGAAKGDGQQPHVTIVVEGTVSLGPGKSPQPFFVETGATMRGSDI